MQAVPYMAFTTKSVESGNSAKAFQSSGYGADNQSRSTPFGDTLQRVTRELSGKSHGLAVSKRPTPVSQNKKAGTAQSTEGDNDPATQGSEATSLTRRELEILQMLGLADFSQLLGATKGIEADSSQTGNQANKDPEIFAIDLAQLQLPPSLADLIKTLTGQTENIPETMDRLQKLWQQLGFNLDLNRLQNLGNDGLAALNRELLTALNLDSDVQSQSDFLVKLAEAAARLDSAKGTANLSVPGDGRTGKDGQTAVGHEPAGESQMGQQTRNGGDQNSGIAVNKLVGKVKTNQAEDRNTEVKPTEVKLARTNTAETNTAEAKQNEVKPAEVKIAEAKQAGTGEVKLTEVKPAGLKSSEAEATKVIASEAKSNEVKSNEVKSNEVKSNEVKSNEIKPIRIADSQMPDINDRQVKMNGAGTSVNPNQGQQEFRLNEPSNSFLPANGDLNSAQIPKASEPPVNIPRMAQVIFGQIAQKAKLLVTPGTTEMQIQLKPDFLGKMNLSIASENGVVTAKFNTESYRVKEIIEANLNTLKDSLAQQGVKVDQLIVNVATQKDSSGYQEHNHSNYYRNSGKKSESAATISEEGFEKLFPADLEARNIQAYYGNTVDFKA